MYDIEAELYFFPLCNINFSLLNSYEVLTRAARSFFSKSWHWHGNILYVSIIRNGFPKVFYDIYVQFFPLVEYETIRNRFLM